MYILDIICNYAWTMVMKAIYCVTYMGVTEKVRLLKSFFFLIYISNTIGIFEILSFDTNKVKLIKSFLLSSHPESYFWSIFTTLKNIYFDNINRFFSKNTNNFYVYLSVLKIFIYVHILALVKFFGTHCINSRPKIWNFFQLIQKI